MSVHRKRKVQYGREIPRGLPRIVGIWCILVHQRTGFLDPVPMSKSAVKDNDIRVSSCQTHNYMAPLANHPGVTPTVQVSTCTSYTHTVKDDLVMT